MVFQQRLKTSLFLRSYPDLIQVKSSQVAFNKKAMTIALHVHNII